MNVDLTPYIEAVKKAYEGTPPGFKCYAVKEAYTTYLSFKYLTDALDIALANIAGNFTIFEITKDTYEGACEILKRQEVKAE
jgi:hypothetical protein